MKRFTLLALSVLLFALVSMAFSPFQVSQPPQPLAFDPLLSTVMILVVGFASLAGVATLVAALVNAGKVLGVVRDGTAPRWTAALNLLAFIALVSFRVFRPDITLEILDGYAGQIATVAVFVLGFVIQMAGSKPAHDVLSAAGIPLIGKSFSGG